LQARLGSGGLITALAPVLRSRDVVWIGWPGVSQEITLNGQLNSAACSKDVTLVYGARDREHGNAVALQCYVEKKLPDSRKVAY
jgi:trehalose-6-phosphate synthase